jgi:hypothetical protein
MKKIIIGFFAITTLFACSNNKKIESNTVDPKSLTSIKFMKDVFEFGKITEGDKVTNAFIFKNTGKLPLIITNATATCGCTIPNWPKEPINPGETGKIDVIFSSIGKKGLQDKVVTVTANTNPAESKVHLIGEVLVKK